MGRCEQAALAEAKAYTSRQAVERDIDRGRPIRVAVLSDCYPLQLVVEPRCSWSSRKSRLPDRRQTKGK